MIYLFNYIVVGLLLLIALISGFLIGFKVKQKKKINNDSNDLYFVYYDKCLEILKGYKRNKVSFNSLSELVEDISLSVFESNKDIDDSQYLLLYGTICYILTEHMLEKDIIQFIPSQSIHEHSDVDDEVLSRFSEKVQPHSKKYTEDEDGNIKFTAVKDTRTAERPSEAVYHMDSVINNFYEE